MSRVSVRTFLIHARKQLQQAHKHETITKFVVGNESADLDSIVCAVLYGYIESSKIEARRSNTFTVPVTNIPAADLSLRPELTALLRHAGVQPSDLITLDDIASNPLPAERTTWTLVDHNVLTGVLAKTYSKQQSSVIDHHDDERRIPDSAQPRIITKSGSCASLVTNHCREAWSTISDASSNVGAALGQTSYHVTDDTAFTSTWDAQLAKLALGAILIDTNDMKSEDKVTQHDVRAVRYLEARINASHRLGKDYDRDRFFREISEAKADLDSLSLKDVLRKDYKMWSENGLNLGMASVVKPIEYLQKKDGDFVPTLVEFAKERDLHLLAVMTAFTDSDGQFARELLVLALDGDDGKAAKVAQSFADSAAEELKLEESLGAALASSENAKWIKLWGQKNVAASRKQVGPLIRQAMRGSSD